MRRRTRLEPRSSEGKLRPSAFEVSYWVRMELATHSRSGPSWVTGCLSLIRSTEDPEHAPLTDSKLLGNIPHRHPLELELLDAIGLATSRRGTTLILPL